MRLILVRHFRTQSNEARRIMGWGDAPPASDWESDLLDVNHCLMDRGLVFDAIHSSNLGRARNTALYYARSRGRDVVESHVAFNEINYGELFGLDKDEVTQAYPQFKQDPDYVFPGGESFRQMQARCLAQLLDMAAGHPTQTLLLVAHAGVIRVLVCHLQGLDLASNLRRKISHRYIGDFRFVGRLCTYYEELGQPSGFVRDGILTLPWTAPAS
ncbi:MAG: histidine phosphatase family protein [Chromatiaceae bacterium]